MNDRPDPTRDAYGIAVVERDTGLSKDTLRVWERRYGFPTPLRDDNGERLYPSEQIEKLRMLRRLMDNGYRPGKIVPLDADALEQLSDQICTRTPHFSAPERSNEVGQLMELLQSGQSEALRQAMSAQLMRMGLEQFVLQVAAPTCGAVGEAWARGEIQIYEEHLFTEQLVHLLRNALSGVPQAVPGEEDAWGRPRVLLTTFPQEPHALGLLMAEVLFTAHGCSCTSLGVQTPVADIALAAKSHKVDLVALSFSAAMNGTHVLDGLLELRSRLPESIEVWAGGQAAALSKKAVREAEGVRTVTQLPAIGLQVADWRVRHPAA